MQDARREQLRKTERRSSWIRLALVGFCGLTYAFLLDPTGTVPWLAYGVLGGAAAYTLLLLRLEPYREYGFHLSPASVTVADTALVGGFVVATGGYSSPYYLLWYASIFAAALRYRKRETAGIATGYALAYAGILAVQGALVPHLAEAVVRIGFVFLLGALGAVLSDVTAEQTVAKHRYEALSARWREQAAILQASLDATADGLLIVDEDGRVVASNQRFREMWRIPDGVAETGDDEALLAHVAQQVEDPEAFRERVDEIYANPEAETFDLVEFDDGRVFERYSRPQYLDGEATGRVWSFRDVTEDRRMRRQLEESNERLEHFAHLASHDLQEPLRLVSGHLGIVERRLNGELDEEARESLGYAVAAAERMQRMIDGLLAYARVEAEGARPTPFDLEAAVDEAVANLAATADEAGATVRVDDLPRVVGDRNQITQVVQNLVANALKYNQTASPTVEISARLGNEGTVEVRVADDGPGIPPHEREEVFEMFQRGSSARSTDGSGIGLGLCRKIVDRHGGEIWIEPRGLPGDGPGGCTIAFTLPAADANPHRVGPYASTGLRSGERSRGAA